MWFTLLHVPRGSTVCMVWAAKKADYFLVQDRVPRSNQFPTKRDVRSALLVIKWTDSKSKEILGVGVTLLRLLKKSQKAQALRLLVLDVSGRSSAAARVSQTREAVP